MRCSPILLTTLAFFAVVECAGPLSNSPTKRAAIPPASQPEPPPKKVFVYWVDRTCLERPNFSAYLEEARLLAKQSYTRLGKNFDFDYAAVYERIFKVKRSVVTNYDQVRKIMGGIGLAGGVTIHEQGSHEWKVVTDIAHRESSDVRVYCDNDQRWQGSAAAGWHDPVNHMRISPHHVTDGPGDGRECSKDGLQGATYLLRDAHPTENPNRVTTTICDYTFNWPRTNKQATKLSDYPPNFDFATLGTIAELEQIISFVIIHEWTHANFYNIRDQGAVDDSYGWQNILAMNAETSLDNADNYSFLAIWAGLAEKKYSLPRQDGSTAAEKKKANEDAEDGIIVKYDDYTV